MYPHPQMPVSGNAPWINIVSRQTNTPSPAKAEGVIDPQLSQSHLGHRQESSLVSFEDDTGASHRSYVPHMGGWQNASPPTHQSAAQTSSPTSNPQQPAYGYERDAMNDDDFLDTILRSPTRTEYPDPAEYGGLPVAFPSIEQEQPDATVEYLRDPSPGTENTGPIQSPVLKGVIYKGMGIFDSASPEAQRRRNQKKDGSRIQRMQNDSAAVEQVENIYFADGTLKKARLITGNVESSPPRELSPPPVPKKRQRTKVNKEVLREISTNGSNVGKGPRQRKIALGNLQQISEKALVALDHDDSVCPQSTFIDYHSMDEEPERHLTFGATDNVRRQDFKIFRDQIDYNEDLHKSRQIASFSQTAAGKPSLHSHGSGSTHRRVPLATCQSSSQRRSPAQLEHPASDSFPRTFGEKFSASMAYNRENRQPLGSEGRADGSAGSAFEQRITQRYFSVAGNQAPQYYSTLPPQMEFGGLSEPKYYGTTLNPLNTQLHAHEFSPYTDQSSFH